MLIMQQRKHNFRVFAKLRTGLVGRESTAGACSSMNTQCPVVLHEGFVPEPLGFQNLWLAYIIVRRQK